MNENSPNPASSSQQNRPVQRAKVRKAMAPATKGKTENAPPPTPLETVVIRNAFYKDGYRKALRIAYFEGFVIIGLLFAFVLTLMSTEPQNRYFATTADGRLIPMISLAQPNLSDAALLSWVAQATTETMTFGFHDYRRRLQESSRYFTRRGWESFTEALDRARIIEAVEERQQVISAVPSSAPVIVSEGVVNGQYRWVVELPIIVTYKSGSSRRPNSLRVRLTVVRVPTLDNPSGVGIEQWVAS